MKEGHLLSVPMPDKLASLTHVQVKFRHILGAAAEHDAFSRSSESSARVSFFVRLKIHTALLLSKVMSWTASNFGSCVLEASLQPVC